MVYLPKVLVAVGIALAMAFILSCSSSDDDGGTTLPSSSSDLGADPSSSSEADPSSSSSDTPSSSSSEGEGTESVTYGGETYQTVVIGTQTWFARNLNYDPGTGYSACYREEPSNCDTYGRLYSWLTAMALGVECYYEGCDYDETQHQGICPEGWHIPSDADLNTLIEYAGGESEAGAKLRASTGWNPSDGVENLDTYGFSALPGGLGQQQDCVDCGFAFGNVGSYGYWWLSNSTPSRVGALRLTISYDGELNNWEDEYTGNLHSVRCLKDE